ncbi:MAG: protein-L-isoaspartate(D-aspartate) O-methyltransferase [Alphaproteobacteria bacterium]|nr:protein-L-isoaspartate(D-aspartate) O-methyltransferase [Alphaproteobacteria bacterium]
MSTPNHKIRLLLELRGTGVTDTRVLSAIERVPREIFVPAALRDRAYENTPLPIGLGQTLSQPTVVGLMTQALELQPKSKVLEIGTGSGYQTSVLALLARRVYTIERHRPLLGEAEKRFRQMSIHNVTSRFGDGWKGWPELAPFERIIVTAAPEEVPQALLDQLAPGGIMVIPVGPAGDQRLLRIRRGEADLLFTTEELTMVRFVPLVEGMPDAAEGGR